MLTSRNTDLQPIQDNDTRWLSHYSSIERALIIKSRLQLFSERYQQAYDLEPLSAEDWNILEELYAVLQPFFAAVKDLQSHATEGHHGSVWEWIPTIEYLWKFCQHKLVEYQAKYGKNHAMAIACQNAWQKLDIYWRASDKAETMYAAATLLAPCGRKAYFERNWPEEEMTSMIETVHSYYLEFYANQIPVPDKTKTIAYRPTPREMMLGMHTTMSESQQQTQGDAFFVYINKPPERDEVDVLNWWLQYGPIELRQMALDILSIPAMSAEVERVFSSAKRLLTPDRNALNIESLEIYETLRNWWRGDIILQRQDDGTPEELEGSDSDEEEGDSEVGDDEV